ncbi:hypothetical protein MRB53_040991 [Persea americana]|nr:hypothetical protein MRB53_040991 [Persea americana]
MDAMQQNPNATMQNPQMSPTRTMPQTPQSQAQQQYLQQLQQQRMSQTPQSQGAPATPSQANAQLPTANGWATPQNAMDMKQANQFTQHRKSMSRQADGSPAPMPPAGFPVASPALTNKMIDPAEDHKPVNGIDPNVPEESEIDPTNYVPRSSVLTNQWGGIDPDSMGQLGFHIAAFKPNVPDIDEMGIIDIRALSLSLQSGIHEEQTDFLAEQADEVSDTVDPKSYEETTRQIKLELEGLQPVPDVGSSDWNLDRAADKLLACTSILRNLSFMAKNTHDLSREPTVKFVSMLARLLGTREVLLRSYVNTQDCMKDLVTLLSNVADQVELPSRDDANNILHFLLAFAPEGPAAGSPSTKNALRFPLYNPRSQRYYPLALDTLAKLLARDEPNRTYLKEIMLDQSAAQSDSAQPVLQKFDILTRVFGFAIAVLPDRHSISTSRMPNTNDLVVRVAEARLASLAQGMLAADILASLIPASETTLARLWLESEDGWAVSLFWLITFMCHRRQQHEIEMAGAGRRGSTSLMPSRTGRPGAPEEPLNLMGAVNQRAAALLKKLGCKIAEGFGIAAPTDDAAVKPVSHASEERFDVDVIPLSLDEDVSTASALDAKGSGAHVMNGISEDAIAASKVNGASKSELVTDSLDADYERAKFWSGVAGEILPRAETLFGAFATPTLDLALLRDFVDLADLV